MMKTCKHGNEYLESNEEHDPLHVGDCHFCAIDACVSQKEEIENLKSILDRSCEALEFARDQLEHRTGYDGSCSKNCEGCKAWENRWSKHAITGSHQDIIGYALAALGRLKGE